MIKESQIQKAILQYLQIKGVFCFVNKTTGTFDPVRKSFRANTTHKGVSDILGIYQGRFLAVEVKSKTGRPTPEQTKFIEDVNNEGGIAFIARGIEDIERMLL